MAALSAVDLDAVSLGFAGRAVLRDVSLSIRVGEFVGLLGPNGAGKTTLLRAMLGLIRPLAGTISLFGETVARGAGRVGYMPQARTMVPGSRISGRDFVATAADGQRWGLPWPGREIRREVAWALEMVGAEAIATRPLMDLSGGERQRLLLAQALLGRPKLLLLDEPLISLDPRHQQAVVALVRQLQAELGLTVLFSAHELNPLLDAIDRVLYLGGGRAAIGRVEDVITGPVLSSLYETDIEVVRAAGHIFIMAGVHQADHDAHRHEHGSHV